MNRRERLQFLATWIFIGIVPLCIRPLWEPDEGRYAEISREMLASWNWLTPHLNGVLYFEKPPFQYWLSALSMKVFGLNATAARLPLALAWGISMYCAWRLARRMGAPHPMRAVAIAATTILGFITGQILTLDALFTAFVLLTITAALEAVLARREGRPSLGWTLLSFVSMAGGMLTKGLAVLVLTGGVFLLTLPLAWPDRRLRRAVFTTGFHPLGWGLFSLLAVPWFWLVERANPGHAAFFFIHEHFTRFSSHIHSRQGAKNPVLDKFYFIVVLGIGLLPWLRTGLVALKQGFHVVYQRANSEDDQVVVKRWTTAVLLVASVWPLLFFTFSGSKLPPYVLPCLVPIASLASAFEGDVQSADSRRWKAIELLALGVVILTATIAFRRGLESVGWVIATGLAFGSLGFWTLKAKRLYFAQWMVALSGCFLMLTIAAHFSLSKMKDTAPLVALAPPNAQWICYGVYFQSLPFHIQQRVAVIAGTGELGYGRDHLPEEIRNCWFQEDGRNLSSFAHRLRTNTPDRPVLVLSKRKTWDKADNETRVAFTELGEQGGMIVVQLK